MRYSVLARVALSVGSVGCTSAVDRVVPDPTEITLEKAMVQVVEALRAAEDRSKETGPTTLGLNPCTVRVTFNITAGGQDKNQVVIDANVTRSVSETQSFFGINASNESVMTSTRGNQVEIFLTSVLCNPPETLGTLRPGELERAARQAQEIRDRRWTIMREPGVQSR